MPTHTHAHTRAAPQSGGRLPAATRAAVSREDSPKPCRGLFGPDPGPGARLGGPCGRRRGPRPPSLLSPAQDTLTEISEWLEGHPREVLILACRNFDGMTADLHEYLATCIRNIFGDMLCPRGVRHRAPHTPPPWGAGEATAQAPSAPHTSSHEANRILVLVKLLTGSSRSFPRPWARRGAGPEAAQHRTPRVRAEGRVSVRPRPVLAYGGRPRGLGPPWGLARPLCGPQLHVQSAGSRLRRVGFGGHESACTHPPWLRCVDSFLRLLGVDGAGAPCPQGDRGLTPTRPRLAVTAPHISRADCRVSSHVPRGQEETPCPSEVSAKRQGSRAHPPGTLRSGRV